MTTIGSVVERTRSLLMGSMATQLTVTSAPYEPGDPTLSLSSFAPVGQGYVLSAGLTTFNVLTADSAAPRVLAGQDGSPVSSLPSGTPVLVRPLHTNWMIFQEIVSTASELSSSSNGLYRTSEETFSIDYVDCTYQLSASPLRVLTVRNLVTGTADRWRDVPFKEQRGKAIVTVDVTLDATVLAIKYALPFGTPTAVSDTLADLGMPEHYSQMLSVGAARNLALSTESRRAQPFSQGDPRRAEEVPISANVMVHDRLKATFKAMVAEERARLVQQHPYQAAMFASTKEIVS